MYRKLIDPMYRSEKIKMARKPGRKPARKPPQQLAMKAPSSPSAASEVGSLTKGQIRKLTALKKSVGDDIGTAAFDKWLASQSTQPKAAVDKNAEQIVGALEPLVETKKLRIPRGGYLVKRGRGRVIATRAKPV